MPAIMTSSEATSPAIPAGLLASFSSSQKCARPIETIGSHGVS
jgi:hypothetical protein